MFYFLFCYPLEDKILYRVDSKSSLCALPSCRLQLRFGLQSLGLPQKETLLRGDQEGLFKLGMLNFIFKWYNWSNFQLLSTSH
jgi:hypothetical protein